MTANEWASIAVAVGTLIGFLVAGVRFLVKSYLSGRAVKVCKGLMEEDDLDMHESLRDWFKKYTNFRIPK